MARYTLKTFCDIKELEIFEHRTTAKLKSILSHDKFCHAGETGPFGEILTHPNRCVIVDSMRQKLFDGSIPDCINFIKKL
jgi:hypothetical protein